MRRARTGWRSEKKMTRAGVWLRQEDEEKGSTIEEDGADIMKESRLEATGEGKETECKNVKL